jgi:hypothetical protein
MPKRLLILATLALALGGCSLQNQAATDTGAAVASPDTVVASPAPDTELNAVPSPGTGSDTASLEQDVNSTVILDEDFSDLN